MQTMTTLPVWFVIFSGIVAMGSGCSGECRYEPGDMVGGDAGVMFVGDAAAVVADAAAETDAHVAELVTPGAKRVFVTSREYKGDLVSLTDAADGATAADIVCERVAQAVGLEGHFKAFISTSREDAIDRIQGTGPFVRLDGVVVAETHEGLLTELLAPISITERGEDVCGYAAYQTAWTGSRADGRWDLDDCDGWTSNESAWDGKAGGVCNTDDQWINGGGESFCTRELRFYCFEQ